MKESGGWSHAMIPGIGDKLDIALILKDGNIKLPETWTRRNNIRDTNSQGNTTMIRKRTWNDITR